MIRLKQIRIARLDEKRFFYLLSVLYLINQVFSETQFMDIKIVSLILFVSRYAVLGGLTVMFVSHYRKVPSLRFLTLAVMATFAILSLILKDGGLSFLPMILIVLCSKGCSVNKMFRLTTFTLVITHLIVIISSKIGIVEDKVDIRFIGEYSGSILGGLYERHNMGFMVHNQVALAFFIVYLLLIAYRRERITIIESTVIMVMNYFVFVLFGSRIVFILGIVTCALYYGIKLVIRLRKGKSPKNRLTIWYLSFPVCALISLLLTMTYRNDNSFSVMMDKVLNNRLHLGKEALDYYGFGLLSFGQDAGSYNSTELLNNTVDNGYIAVYLQMGFVAAVILLGIWTYLAYVCEKKHNAFLTMVFVMLAIENIINSHMGSYKMLPFFCILLNQNDVFLSEETMLMQMVINAKKNDEKEKNKSCLILQ